MTLPRTKGRYTLHTGTREDQFGCILLQKKEERGNLHISYWSRTLKDTEQKLGTIHRQCLAVIWTVTLLGRYLKETRLTIRTDHEALWSILTTADATGKSAQWSLTLLHFEFDIVHRTCIKHQVADVLSRFKTNVEDTNPLEDKFSAPTIPWNHSYVRLWRKQKACSLRENSMTRSQPSSMRYVWWQVTQTMIRRR